MTNEEVKRDEYGRFIQNKAGPMARLIDSPEPPGVLRDFWTSLYQAIDD